MAMQLRKCRAKIDVAMKASGRHSDDMWTHLRKTFLTPRAGAAALPGAAVYCLNVLCSKNTEIDAAFTEDLAENAKADSNIAVGKDEAAGQGNKGGKSKASEFIAMGKELREDMAAEQRETLIGLHRQHLEEDAKSSKWKECLTLSDAVSKMIKEERTDVLKNIGVRVRKLEAALGLKNSIVDLAKPNDFVNWSTDSDAAKCQSRKRSSQRSSEADPTAKFNRFQQG